MGASEPRRGDQVGRESLSRAARVVPRVPTFAVDRGFWYHIPDSLEDRVRIGTIVRVPLSGRRVRGYVVEVGSAEGRGSLKPIQSVSGDYGVFGPEMLASLEWAAGHYIAPLGAVLDRAAPPNLPRASRRADFGAVPVPDASEILSEIARRSANGGEPGLTAVVARRRAGWISGVGPVLGRGRSALVVVATVVEAERLQDEARALYGARAILAAGDDRALTEAWTAARQPGCLLIGTPRTATWEIPDLALAVVVEEGRRAMKDRQTPTIHVRDLLLRRFGPERFSVVFIGPTPTVEVMAARADIVRDGPRAWSLVEVVDRRQDPPGSGHLAEATIAGLRGALANGWRALVFTHRRVGDESMRCTNCRAVRTCPRCGSRMSRESICRRCGLESRVCRYCGGERFEAMGTIPERLVESLNRSLGKGTAAVMGDDARVAVGTERDLAGGDAYELIVVADTDGLALGHNYRSEEEALRVLARLGNLVDAGPGHRLVLQTSMPDAPLIATMRRGDPIPYLEEILARRFRDHLPPAGEMIAVEVRGDVDPEKAHLELVETGATILGPADTTDGRRWLIQGDLDQARPELREVVARWRERGLTVRVDADPIDL